MTQPEALLELLGRVGACRGTPVLVHDEELGRWPGAEVTAMKTQGLLTRAGPASSATCPGCEQECVMPVHALAVKAGAPAAFIVCDKREDINRVEVSAGRLTQWQCSAELVCEFIGAALRLRTRSGRSGGTGRWEIGVASGHKRSQMLCLEADGALALAAGKNTVPLADLIIFQDGKYVLDKDMVGRLVDASTTADERYTPSNIKREARKLKTQARYEAWRKEYRSLRKRRPGMSDSWYSKQIEKMDMADGRDGETIRKKMKK